MGRVSTPSVGQATFFIWKPMDRFVIFDTNGIQEESSIRTVNPRATSRSKFTILLIAIECLWHGWRTPFVFGGTCWYIGMSRVHGSCNRRYLLVFCGCESSVV